MTNFDIRAANLRAINSATKYPSIPTYHTLDPRNGGLLDECVTFPGEVIATEKVDGTNSRIILLPDGSWLLGSREELLTHRDDLISNPALGIVEALRPVADSLAVGETDGLMRVFYLELYGGKIGGQAKQYAADGKTVGWRLFDVALVNYFEVADWPTERISGWRDGGGQTFCSEHQLDRVARVAGLELTPRLLDPFYGDALPSSIEGMAKMLADIAAATRVRLDGGTGKAEGVVFRSPDRGVIAKARHQDYERTLRRRR